jgi:peptidoglycan/LPS O-acetylase OafA/YrhL
MNNYLEKYRRITTSGDYFPEIDGLRFIAISTVVFFHIISTIHYDSISSVQGYELVTTFYKNGWQGVELFFAISGFIIGLPFAKQYILGGRKISYKSYFLRRVTRLEPPYLIIIILLYFLFAMLGKFTLSERFTSLLASMVYMNNVIFQDLNKLVLSVIWSLEIEVQFYVLAIIFAKVFMLPKLWRRLAIMAVIVGFPYLQKLYYPSVNTIYLYIQFFFIGFLLADLYLDEKRPKIPEILGMIMGLATIYVLLFVNHANGIGNHFLYLGSMIVFYYMAMHNKFWKKIMSIRWVAIIGGMCYTIYLIHGPVIGIVGDIGEYLKISDSYMPNLLLNTLISIPLVLFFSGLYFRLVERPCMDKTWPQKLWSFLRSKFSTVASDK